MLVDLPKDVLTEASAEPLPKTVSIRGYNPVTRGHPLQIRKAAQALADARKPLFYLGGGVNIAGAAAAFRKAQLAVDVPTVASLMGIGALPSDHPRFLGMVGMHGTYAANTAVQSCDLLFAIGTRFDDRATGDLAKFAPHATVIHVDIDPASISRNVAVEIPIVGDAASVLEDLLPLLQQPDHAAWIAETDEWKRSHPLGEHPRQRPPFPRDGHPLDCVRVSRCHHLHRGGPAPDVDGPVLQLPGDRARCSPPAAWAPWATASPQQSAPSSATPAGG